ncbi:uncharacterized protein LOC142224793 [Haematobia irritans]|uniref:uncharacterized protein LOC142224793 n=1 Tax=Haematobia irritans TaxID=7368 RepID=UPI003F4FE1D0
MYYLMQKTEGEARDIIKTCPITNEGFQMAWQNLVDRYENKRVLVIAQLKILFNLAPVLKESGPSIKQLQRTMNDCIPNLSLLGIDTKNWDVIFVFICYTRLPEVTLGHWEQSQGSSSDLPKWETMDKFLTAWYQILESVFGIKGAHNISTSGPSYVKKPTSPKRKSSTNSNGNRSFKSFATTVPSNPQQKCPLCSESHPLRLCEEFLRMSVNNRLETVKRLECCTNCLASSHTFNNLSRDSSSRPGMIHDMGNPARSASDDVTSTSEAARSLQTFATAMETSQFSTVVPVVEFCKHALPIFPVTSANIVGLNGLISAKSTNVFGISLCSPIDTTFELSTDAYVVDQLTGRLPTYSLSQLLDVNLPEITMCDLKCSHMDLLLGDDIYSQIMHTDVHKHPNGDLIAQKSVFGWIVTGKVTQTKPLQSVREYPKDLKLGLSRNNAISQLKRNESQLMRNSELKIQYDRVLQEYADLGHMAMVDENKVNSSDTVYYLPHHAVFKPDSATTKLRVVFNASSPTSNGVSLNNRHIVFRLAPEDVIRDFELNKATFGVNCAPYLAIRTLHRLDDDVEGEFPTAAEIIRSQMYVDDILAGAHSLDDAMKSRDELIEVLGAAGLIYENGLLIDFLNISNESTAKTGLRWNAGKDVFFFKLVSAPTRSSVTKRAVLSEIAKLFDPAGWLAPKIMVAKIIMQQIWKDKTDWDECLKPMTLNRWFAFLDDYSEIERIEIPRWVGFSPDHEVQLHAFCDASEKAYAAYTSELKTPLVIMSRIYSQHELRRPRAIGTNNWHHVLSHDNPADIASRGSSARYLLTNKLWWKGPAWLCRPRSEWPKSTFRNMTNLETKPIRVNLNQLSPPEDILALRVLAYVFRFFHRIHPKFRSTQTHSSFNLEQGEINFVKGSLVVLCQRRHFPEYVALENNAKEPSVEFQSVYRFFWIYAYEWYTCAFPYSHL